MTTEDNLDIDLTYNKNGLLNQKRLKMFERAEITRRQLKLFEDWDKIYLHHSSMSSEYISRKSGIRARKYNGRFGVGYIVDIPNFNNDSRNHERRYYIFKNMEPDYVNPFLFS